MMYGTGSILEYFLFPHASAEHGYFMTFFFSVIALRNDRGGRNTACDYQWEENEASSAIHE